jgi:hypothetical protein
MSTPGALPAHVDPNSLVFVNASDGGGNACVDVAFVPDGGVAVRHSRNTDGPVIYYSDAEWDAFVAGAKNGTFDRS